ncbi:MAG: hypothetical protein JXR23_07770 [Pontiellaceae bacterium]|nr:hypothetical protein [Pontiellaceae bacterium]
MQWIAPSEKDTAAASLGKPLWDTADQFRAVSTEQVLLPIWHNITKREVIDYSPSLADKLARTTATQMVEEISDEIIGVIKGAS